MRGDFHEHELEPGIALLQPVPADFVGYRLVLSLPPRDVDFVSHYELDKKPDPTKPYLSYQWFGVSLFEDHQKVERMRRSAHNRGQTAWVATLRFLGQSGLYGIYNERTTHLEVFASPKDLLDLVENVD